MTTTHALPYFTRRLPDGREQTVCGQYVTADQIAPAETAPSCCGCAMWVENKDFHSYEPIHSTTDSERRNA